MPFCLSDRILLLESLAKLLPGSPHTCLIAYSLSLLMVSHSILCPSSMIDVPQGSFWVLCFFTLYTQPLSNIICHHGCVHHKYADDTQLEDSAPAIDFPLMLKHMELCISAVKNRTICNKLQLSDGKTEMICSGLPRSLDRRPHLV